MAAASSSWNSSMPDHASTRVGGARNSYSSTSSGGGRSDGMHYADQAYAQPQSQHGYTYGASGTAIDGYAHSYHQPAHHQDAHHSSSGMNGLSPRSSYHGGSSIDPRLPHGGPSSDYPSTRSPGMNSASGAHHAQAHPIYSHPLSNSVSYGAGRATNSPPSAGNPRSVMASAYTPSGHVTNEEYGPMRVSAHGTGHPRSDYANMRSWQPEDAYARGHGYPNGHANASYGAYQQYPPPAGSHHQYDRAMAGARSPVPRGAVGAEPGPMMTTGGSSKKKRPQLECAVCHSSSTPEWRKGPTGPRTLCNACGLTWAKLAKRKKKEAEEAGLPEPPSPSVSGTGEADLRELQAMRPNATAAAAAAGSGMVGGGAPHH